MLNPIIYKRKSWPILCTICPLSCFPEALVGCTNLFALIQPVLCRPAGPLLRFQSAAKKQSH